MEGREQSHVLDASVEIRDAHEEFFLVHAQFVVLILAMVDEDQLNRTTDEREKSGGQVEYGEVGWTGRIAGSGLTPATRCAPGCG